MGAPLRMRSALGPVSGCPTVGGVGPGHPGCAIPVLWVRDWGAPGLGSHLAVSGEV